MRELTFMEKQAKGLAQVMGRGKITIPKEARDVLGINDGDYVGFIIWKVEVASPEGDN
jgi:AbrB family looped-hinge helix DNA binding protein